MRLPEHVRVSRKTARAIAAHLQYSLAILPRGTTPGLSWGEHPLAWLLDVLRFFLEPLPLRWRALAPPR